MGRQGDGHKGGAAGEAGRWRGLINLDADSVEVRGRDHAGVMARDGQESSDDA